MSFIAVAVVSVVFSALATAPDVKVALVDGSVEISGLDGASSTDWEERVRVTVHHDSTAGDDQPAIVGTYELEGPLLRFHPMFGFEPGMSYRVTIMGVEPEVTVLRVPPRDIEPTTVVTDVYPSSDVLPENQLKLYVHFSAPMSGGDGLAHVRLVDDDGNEVVDPFLPLGEHFWDRERRRYTIFFDPGRVKRGILPNEQLGRPIENGKHYRLVIDADWRDDDGLPLASGFEKAFTAGPPDEVPLDTKSWTVEPPQADTRAPLVVTFPEAIDHEILGRALIVLDDDEREIEGDVRISMGETRWSFEPAEPWRAGKLSLLVIGALEDLAGNRIGQPFEVDVFDRIDRPDEQEVYRLPVEVLPRD